MTSARAIVALIVCVASVARAGDATTDRVKSLYLESTKHYQLGEYKDALTGYTEAYRLKPDPAFLYNIAQCYRQLGQFADAARQYRAFLRDVPAAPNRSEIESRVADMDRAAADKLAKAPPAGTQPPATAAVVSASLPVIKDAKVTPVYRRWWLWTIVAGVVVAGAGVGIGVGVGTSGGVPVPSSSLGNMAVGW